MKRKSVFNEFLWLAVGLAVLCWMAYGWMLLTGTTFSVRVSDEGRNASAADLSGARTRAVLTSLAAAAMLAVAQMRKRG